MFKKIFTGVLLTLCLFLNVAMIPRTASAKTAESHTYSGVYGKIDEFLDSAFKAARINSASVIIVGEDGVEFERAYGGCPDTQTPFLLGSVSKSFTALCIMKLYEEGKIDLDSKISTYLPEYNQADKITVLQLLNHTSGLGERHTLENYHIVGKQGKHVYSNVNYSLLGKIIENVSGKTYEEYIEENVFKPLDMQKSSASLEKSERNGLITGYENYFGFNVPRRPHYPDSDADWITVPAGYLSSSASDLGKYLQSYIKTLNGEKVIVSKENANRMFNDGVFVDGEIPYTYAMGWNKIKEPLTETVYRHSGLIETGMSCIYVLPERNLGIAVLINVNDYLVTQGMMDSIDWSVTLQLLGMEPNEITAWEYPLRHVLYDLVYILLVAAGIIPLALLKLFVKRLNVGRRWLKILLNVLLHVALPTFILLFPIILFATPLWVVKAFVPDLFITLVTSSCLLYVGGAVKGFSSIHKNKKEVKL